MTTQPNKRALLGAFGVEDPDGINQAAGYDVGKWNGLSDAEKQPYIAGGGAPTLGKVAAPPSLAPVDPAAPGGSGLPVPETPALPDYKAMGSFLDSSGAYNKSKFEVPWDQRSEKYQIGTVLSNFDPRKGVTPDLLAALNGADIHGAKFSGSGDELNVNNAGNWERFGKGGSADVVGNFRSGNGTWGAWTDPALEQKQPMGGGMTPMFAGSTISPLLQGNAQQQIQAALAALSSQSPNLQALLQQLGG